MVMLAMMVTIVTIIITIMSTWVGLGLPKPTHCLLMGC